MLIWFDASLMRWHSRTQEIFVVCSDCRLGNRDLWRSEKKPCELYCFLEASSHEFSISPHERCPRKLFVLETLLMDVRKSLKTVENDESRQRSPREQISAEFESENVVLD